MSGSAPNWGYDYQPSVAEWLAAFAAKQDYSATLTQLAAQGQAPATSWTPTDASGASLVFTNVSARAYAFGNMAFVSLSLTYPTTSDTGTGQIGGLPFAVPNANYAQCPAIVLQSPGASPVVAVPVKNSNTIEFLTAVGGSTLSNANLSASTIFFQAIYPLT